MKLKKSKHEIVSYPSMRFFSTVIAGVSITVLASCASNENHDNSVVVPAHRKTVNNEGKNNMSVVPQMDSDGDGIPDEKDKCPDEPEDKDGFQDEDGCPDRDNDGDGIPDTEDACPNQKGEKNSYKKINGCPLAVRTAGVRMPTTP